MAERKKKPSQNQAKSKKRKLGYDGPNPLLKAQTAFLNSLSSLERDDFFSSRLDPEKRAEIWTNQATIGEDLVNRFSWAVPDAQALRILRHFSPLVEIGCGANAYWCQLMKRSGIDVIGFDAEPESGGIINRFAAKVENPSRNGKDSTFPVRRGGPEMLASDEIRGSKRALFLCYPDEGEDTEASDAGDEEIDSPQKSLGASCLEHFQGQYVIHVGELIGDTLSIEQAPWGRSSSPVFQERLAAEYHCLIKVGLTNWLFSRDTISVWKRSERCSIFFGADDDSNEEEVQYKHIPVEERLPVNVAAPCVAHLIHSPLKREEDDVQVIDTAKTTADQTEGYSCPW